MALCSAYARCVRTIFTAQRVSCMFGALTPKYLRMCQIHKRFTNHQVYLSGTAGLGLMLASSAEKASKSLHIDVKSSVLDGEIILCEEQPQVHAAQPCGHVGHPYQRYSVLTQTCFLIDRIFSLIFCFAPLILLSSIAWITNSEWARSSSLTLMVRSFERAGCSFQKLGQWCSMRPVRCDSLFRGCIVTQRQSSRTCFLQTSSILSVH